MALPLAAVVGFLTSIESPLGPALLLPGGIFLTISLYSRRQPAPLTALQGAKMGFLIGLLSFAFYVVFFAVEGATNVPAFHQTMEKRAQDILSQYPTPESREMARPWLTGPHAVMVVTVASVISTFFFLLVIAGITGALAGAFSRPRNLS
jgi:hypothetical protein